MIVVMGCGNTNRSDDGTGPAVIRILQGRDVAHPHPDLRLIDAGTDGMAAMFAARGCDSLIIIDACRSGAPPGTIFELPGAEIAQRYAPGFSLHDFRWDHALHAGRQIFGEAFPSDVVVLLIEAADVGFGIGLSPAVLPSAAMVADRIMELVRVRSLYVAGGVA